ncbi:hypothetical protein V4890_19920 [Ralstonia solanacearum species complex bacterium KE056]|uniref:hypothetical protein n=1 Tax=Ralstonia solanacearum species complex bacterium KE056 TaxID=3119585 RepID=UPI002FC2E44A
MQIDKSIGKTSVFLAVAATLMLIAGQAQSLEASSTVELDVQNGTNKCVRFFVRGPHDVLPASTANLVAQRNQKFMASVFATGTCGGTAIRNVWYTTTKADAQTRKVE